MTRWPCDSFGSPVRSSDAHSLHTAHTIEFTGTQCLIRDRCCLPVCLTSSLLLELKTGKGAGRRVRLCNSAREKPSQNAQDTRPALIPSQSSSSAHPQEALHQLNSQHRSRVKEPRVRPSASARRQRRRVGGLAQTLLQRSPHDRGILSADWSDICKSKGIVY